MDAELQRARFDEWLRAHFAILDRTARGFARDPLDRADLLQELLLAVWKAIPGFREQAQPSTFIYRVAHNAALTWKRKQRRWRGRSQLAELLLAPSDEPRGDDDEGLAQLHAAIHELRPVDRSLILLSLEGLAQPSAHARAARADQQYLGSSGSLATGARAASARVGPGDAEREHDLRRLADGRE